VGSPLLGLPQGLAVYQDGVRLNEPFGDTVNWALIPESAIDSVYVLPGSHPLFGMNALGGAIAVKTKDGLTSPGTRLEGFGGSFGRVAVQAETGGEIGRHAHYFVTGSRLEEDGWRDFSPTRATQGFGKIGAQGEHGSFDVSVTYASTDLIGNGSAPVELLDRDRSAIFTRPDRTSNRYTLLTFAGTRSINSAWTLTGNAYLRNSDVKTLNGDDSDYAACSFDGAVLCLADDDAEQPALDVAGAPIASGAAVEGAMLNRTITRQDGIGFGMQASWNGDLGRHANRFLVGVAREQSDSSFVSSTELGMLDATRLAIGSGVLIGDGAIAMTADTATTGLYASDTVTFGEAVALTMSGRYNRSSVDLLDRIGDELTGRHTFARFNPAVGVTVQVSPAVAFYSSISEASRAPSPVELTCADPEAPCRLPNAFVSDPPLDQVVARTLETGVRGRAGSLRWHAGLFRTTNQDDILFISAGQLTNQGFFANVGETRRQGLELDASGDVGERVTWFASFTGVAATFRDPFTAQSPNNPASDDGEIAVQRGDRLPLIPERLLKFGARFALGDRWHVGGDVIENSGEYLRGDEGNDQPRVSGYPLLNLRAEYRFVPAFGKEGSFFLNVDNALDRRYETFGTFGDATGVLGSAYSNPRFLGPGAPRGVWLGVRFEL
jgi:outer membrane cobalamin receptor